MTVSYHKRCDGTLVRTTPASARASTPAPRPARTSAGPASTPPWRLVLDALTPLAIEAALQVTAQLQAQAEQADALEHELNEYMDVSLGTPAVIIPTITERESNARRLVALGAGESRDPAERRRR